MEVLIGALGGTFQSAKVAGPLGAMVEARFGITHDRVAIVELAQASGLGLVESAQRDPMRATTFGTGQLIALAMQRGCTSILICLGGSATVDGGAGLAQALGFKFFDRDGREIKEFMCGSLLNRIARIQKPNAALPPIRVACDVTNPLCGLNGAAAVYGPQKGATATQVRELDAALANLARMVGGDPNQPGAGAAGGAGLGLAALCGGRLERGIDLVLSAIAFDARCRGAALVLTGEGRLDSQSLQGKACMGVVAAARRLGVSTIAIVGSTGPGADDCVIPAGLLRRYIDLSARFGHQRAMSDAAALVEQTAALLVADAIR